jgi:hypothetical protein
LQRNSEDYWKSMVLSSMKDICFRFNPFGVGV